MDDNDLNVKMMMTSPTSVSLSTQQFQSPQPSFRGQLFSNTTLPTNSTATSTQQANPPSSTSMIAPPPAEKKQRKKWTLEETQMLVSGCNKVRVSMSQFLSSLFYSLF